MRAGNHRNSNYLAFIRKQPCLLTDIIGHEYDPVVAAHQGILGDKGVSIKTSDYTAIPMLGSLHRDQEHQHGHKTFWNKYPHIDLKVEIIRLLIKYIESGRD